MAGVVHSFIKRAPLLHVRAEGSIPVSASGWCVLRASSDGGRYPVLDNYVYATTSPIYVTVGRRCTAIRARCAVFRGLDRASCCYHRGLSGLEQRRREAPCPRSIAAGQGGFCYPGARYSGTLAARHCRRG